MWIVYDGHGDVIAKTDDLYEAEMLAEAVGGSIRMYGCSILG